MKLRIVTNRYFSSIAEFTFVKEIGVGSFGSVKLALHLQTNKCYAVKVVRLSLRRSTSARGTVKIRCCCWRGRSTCTQRSTIRISSSYGTPSSSRMWSIWSWNSRKMALSSHIKTARRSSARPRLSSSSVKHYRQFDTCMPTTSCTETWKYTLPLYSQRTSCSIMPSMSRFVTWAGRLIRFS